MNFEYEIYPEQKLIVTRFKGAFTLADLKTVALRLWGDQRYSRSYDGIVDLSDSTVAVGRDDFRALLDFVRGHKDTSMGRWAAVADSPLAAACGLLYKKALVGRHTFEVFSTFEAAGAFIGVEWGSGPWPGTKSLRRS